MTIPDNDQFKLIVRPMDPISAAQIVDWHYPPPYDIYNLVENNPQRRELAIAYLLDPIHLMYTMKTVAGALAAFCSYGHDAQVPGGEYPFDAMDIGMGVHPDWTGRGWGHIFADTAVSYAQYKLFSPAVRVTIAAFNIRAQKVWLRLKFKPIQEFVAPDTNMPFIIMRKELQ